jgi:hypothetical protein
LTSKAALIPAKVTDACGIFISPSAERPIVRRFDTQGKTRAGFMAPPAQPADSKRPGPLPTCPERWFLSGYWFKIGLLFLILSANWNTANRYKAPQPCYRKGNQNLTIGRKF